MKAAVWRVVALTVITVAALFVAFGPYVQYASDQFGLYLTPDNAGNAVVHSVEPGSAAARAGIRPGDTLQTARSDLLSRAAAGYPPPGASAQFIVNGSRRVTLTERTNNMAAHDIGVFTWIRLLFLAVAALLAWRRPDDASARTLVVFLFATGFGIALNNHEFGIPIVSVIVLQLGSLSLVLFGLGAGARFAAMFPGSRPEGAAAAMSRAATYISSAGIAVFLAVSLFWPEPIFRRLATLSVTTAFIATIALLGAILIERYVHAPPSEKQRRLWIFVILFLGLLGPAVDLAVQIFFGINPTVDMYASLTLAIIPIGFAYVILRHRVIDVGFVLNRAAVFALMSVVVVGVFVILETLLGKYVESSNHVTSTAVEIAVALVLGFSIRAIHTRVDRFVDTVFFRERHEAEAALRTFAHDAQFITDEQVLGERCVQTVMRYAGATAAALWLRSPEGYRSAFATYVSALNVDENDPALVAMRARHVVVDLEDAQSALPGVLAFPMTVRGELIGALVCGAKKADESYAPDERDALESVASAVAHALDALEVQELRRRAALEEGLATRGVLGMS